MNASHIEQMNFEKAVQDASMRKEFPTLEEQMDKLEPELQVELHNMEERYDREIQTARTIRIEIIDMTHNNLQEANLMCSAMVTNAVETRQVKIKELRGIWGKFFYANPK
jgi:hypothetical protein